jgi:crotonobetainyl-CoA:carnitine CoA-transferase CaiB-like acyl-CoA transferase
MSDIFDGVRVLELAQWVMVPAAGAVLSNLGADVIKIERPNGGDPLRGLNTAMLGHDANDFNARIEQNNSGKRSVGLDIQTEGGRDLVNQMLDHADVFLTNFRSSTLERLGLDVASVQARNPRVIYARGNGFGARGPHADRPAYDASAFWARGGFAQTLTPPGLADPVQQRPALGDHTAAMNLAFGIAAALYQREHTGQVTVVDVSLLSTAMWMLSSDITAAFNPGYRPQNTARAPQQSPLVGTFATSDDRWIALVFMEPDRYWAPFCNHIGRPDLATDERFAAFGERQQHIGECLEILRELFASRPYEEWRDIVAELNAPWEPMQSIADLHTDRQVLANDYLMEIGDHDGNERLVAIPAQFDGASARPQRAPEFGEHTEQVLLDLGLDWDAITKLKDAGVII